MNLKYFIIWSSKSRIIATLMCTKFLQNKTLDLVLQIRITLDPYYEHQEKQYSKRFRLRTWLFRFAFQLLYIKNIMTIIITERYWIPAPYMYSMVFLCKRLQYTFIVILYGGSIKGAHNGNNGNILLIMETIRPSIQGCGSRSGRIRVIWSDPKLYLLREKELGSGSGFC